MIWSRWDKDSAGTLIIDFYFFKLLKNWVLSDPAPTELASTTAVACADECLKPEIVCKSFSHNRVTGTCLISAKDRSETPIGGDESYDFYEYFVIGVDLD